VTRRTRRRLLIAGFAIVVYVGSYVPLTLFGEYRIDMTGRHRPWGLALMDVYLWQPKAMYFRVYTSVSGDTECSSDLLGAVYAPLILIDRAVWHRSRFIF
jgi:hypothetical protein